MTKQETINKLQDCIDDLNNTPIEEFEQQLIAAGHQDIVTAMREGR